MVHVFIMLSALGRSIQAFNLTECAFYFQLEFEAEKEESLSKNKLVKLTNT